MNYLATFLILIISLALTACNNSEPQKITVTGTKTFSIQEKHEIIEWEKALEIETRSLVDSGYNNFEEIIKKVSKKTQELELSARTAYINQHLEYYKLGNELALEATQQQLDPEHKEMLQNHFKQIDKTTEDEFRAAYDKKFSERKNRLFETYYQNSNVLQKDS